jgi:hypothetical protein
MRREMKVLIQIDQIVRVMRGLVVATILALPFLWQPSFLPDSGIASIGWVIACWIAAGVVGHMRLWKDCLDVLLRRRMQCFWEWRSATLRFPVQSMTDTGLFDRSELPPKGSEPQNKPPYLPD